VYQSEFAALALAHLQPIGEGWKGSTGGERVYTINCRRAKKLGPTQCVPGLLSGHPVSGLVK